MSEKRTSIIKNKIYPIIEKSLMKNTNSYRKCIQECFSERQQQIYEIAPYYRLYFKQDDIDKFFNSIKIEEKEVEKYLTETYYWNMNFNPKAAKDPFTVANMCCIRYFIIKNDIKNAELSSIYLAFSGKFYPSIHYNSFPVVQPIEYKHVMDYVVNQMLTQKFDLKREGTVFGAIRSLVKTWLNTYWNVFKDNPNDEDFADLIQQLHGRIKSFMTNIATLYYKAYDNELYLSYDSDNYSEDNFRIADNDFIKAERYVENTMNVINNNNIDIKLVKISSDANIKIDELRNIIEAIQSDKENIPVIKELLRIIIAEYFRESSVKDVASIDFVNRSIASKPNSKNPNIIRQKEIIEGWLDEKSPNYRRRKSRAATASSYYKSILKYYVLLINKYNK